MFWNSCCAVIQIEGQRTFARRQSNLNVPQNVNVAQQLSQFLDGMRVPHLLFQYALFC